MHLSLSLGIKSAAVGRTGELALPHTSNGLQEGSVTYKGIGGSFAKDMATSLDVLPRGAGGCTVYPRRGTTGHSTGETG